MKKILMVFIAGILFPVCTQAQLSKLMAEFHEKECVSVTQLDKSLYDLYKRNGLPKEAEELLQNLDEVNFLNLNLNLCNPEMEEKVTTKFRTILDNPNQYRLVKSYSDEATKQLIYTKSKNDKISDLVVWNRTPIRLDIIELKGNIQLNKIAMLSKALNIKGLNSLAVLSPDNDSYNTYKRSNDYTNDMSRNMENMNRHMQQMIKEMFGDFHDSGFDSFFNNTPGMIDHSFKEMFEKGGDGFNIISHSVHVTKENGKTKIKIDSQNSDMTYVIDGKEVKQEGLEMPENIRNVYTNNSREDFRKSYLFIISENKIGNFVSYKDGVLTFNYEKQEYKFNLEKANTPLLTINGRLTNELPSDLSRILQIRPLSKIEKEHGGYRSAEVLINTK